MKAEFRIKSLKEIPECHECILPASSFLKNSIALVWMSGSLSAWIFLYTCVCTSVCTSMCVLSTVIDAGSIKSRKRISKTFEYKKIIKDLILTFKKKKKKEADGEGWKGWGVG